MKITTIIPVHEYDSTVEKYLADAINSVSKQNKIDEDRPVLIVYSASINDNKEFIEFTNKKFDGVSISLLKNDGNTDFQSQINFAVERIETEWFSILEFDDELSLRYYHHALHHIDKLPDVDLFLPLLAEVNNENALMKLTNETVWSKQFVGENGQIGYLNAIALNNYTDFKISGAIFKKSEFLNCGGLKTNIKLTFTYEFLLRLLNNGCNIYSIPRIGVKHLVTREGSLFHYYGETMSLEEKKFWFNTAKKESNFYTDRVIDTSMLKTNNN